MGKKRLISAELLLIIQEVEKPRRFRLAVVKIPATQRRVISATFFRIISPTTMLNPAISSGINPYPDCRYSQLIMSILDDPFQRIILGNIKVTRRVGNHDNDSKMMVDRLKTIRSR